MAAIEPRAVRDYLIGLQARITHAIESRDGQAKFLTDAEKRAETLAALDAWTGAPVMLKLSLPTEAGLFQPLVDHPKVLRVVALSGGFSRAEACEQLSRNRGMIASFSRALLSDLRHEMDEDEFDRSLAGAIDEIREASFA